MEKKSSLNYHQLKAAHTFKRLQGNGTKVREGMIRILTMGDESECGREVRQMKCCVEERKRHFRKKGDIGAGQDRITSRLGASRKT